VNSFQQAILFCLIILGHPILISSTVLFVRKRAFESRFRTIVEAHARKRSASAHTIHLPRLAKKMFVGDPDTPVSTDAGLEQDLQISDVSIQIAQANTKTQFETETRDVEATGWSADDDQITIHSPTRERPRHRMFSMAGVGARPDARDPRDAAPGLVIDEERRPSLIETISRNSHRYFSSKFISRNSQFHGLTPREREKLGGVEYKAICLLSIIVPLYFVLFNVLGFIGLGTWLTVNRPDVARTNGLGPFWTGSFFAVSAFGNNGMSLLDLNMTALQTG
jgi:Cation transport protein